MPNFFSNIFSQTYNFLAEGSSSVLSSIQSLTKSVQEFEFLESKYVSVLEYNSLSNNIIYGILNMVNELQVEDLNQKP